MKSSGIGGQAVIEGIMMKNGDRYAVGVRKPNQEILVEVKEYKGVVPNKKVRKIPILRGVLSFLESMALGMKTLSFSAGFFEEAEEQKISKVDRVLNKVFKDKLDDIVMGVTMLVSIVLAVGLFMILPYVISDLIRPYVVWQPLFAIIEGGIRVAIFIGYLLLITQMKDIQRTFRYHGAEHKCINCIESGRLLTVENVRGCSKQHKRCGTSFLLIVMLVSILFFLFIKTPDPVWRIVVRILLLPVIAGVSYEFIRFAGNHDVWFVRLLSAPGLLLQRLTTKEPDDAMIEVAIQAVEAVFDWKKYQVEQGFLTQEEADRLRALEGIEFL